jgi:hypothetical protein
MEQTEHHLSTIKTWSIVILMVGWVFFKGWLAYHVVGDLGQPDWDYRPIKDVPAESAFAVNEPYHPLPSAQHVLGRQGQEENPSHLSVVPLQGLQ